MPARCSVYYGAGNYLVQKLIDYATLEQRMLILQHSAADLVSISLNTHGTRSHTRARRAQRHCLSLAVPRSTDWRMQTVPVSAAQARERRRSL